MFPDLTRDDVFRLETARLWLRWPRLADKQAIVRLAGEKAVAEMTAQVPHPYPPDAADRFLFEARKANATGEALHLAITAKGRDEAIGMIGLTHAGNGDLELGYWLGRPYWSEGYCSQAAEAVVTAAFRLTSAQGLVAAARVLNPASRRVLEKCGFQHAGARLMAFPARGGAFAVDRFELDRRDWLRRSRAETMPERDTSGRVADWSEAAACA